MNPATNEALPSEGAAASPTNDTEAPAFDPDMAVNFWASPAARRNGLLPGFTWCANGTTREREDGMPATRWCASGDAPDMPGDSWPPAVETEEEACM